MNQHQPSQPPEPWYKKHAVQIALFMAAQTATLLGLGYSWTKDISNGLKDQGNRIALLEAAKVSTDAKFVDFAKTRSDLDQLLGEFRAEIRNLNRHTP